MTHAVKSNTSRIWHLTNEKPNTDSVKTKCNKTLSYPDHDRDGYRFDQMDSWPAFRDHPESAWQLCHRCGTMADFMDASQERWTESEAHEKAQQAAQAAAKQKATDKAETLNQAWRQTLEALESVGWQIQPPQYRRYRATMQINSFTFEMEFVRPDTAFGVNTSTGEIVEMIK